MNRTHLRAAAIFAGCWLAITALAAWVGKGWVCAGIERSAQAALTRAGFSQVSAHLSADGGSLHLTGEVGTPGEARAARRIAEEALAGGYAAAVDPSALRVASPDPGPWRDLLALPDGEARLPAVAEAPAADEGAADPVRIIEPSKPPEDLLPPEDPVIAIGWQGDTLRVNGMVGTTAERDEALAAISLAFPEAGGLEGEIIVAADVRPAGQLLDSLRATAALAKALPPAGTIIADGDDIAFSGTVAGDEAKRELEERLANAFPGGGIHAEFLPASTDEGDWTSAAREVALGALESGSVFFEALGDNAADAESARADLEKAARAAARLPDLSVLVSGYADDRATPGECLERSRERAEFVADILAGAGLSRGRIIVRGMGRAAPHPDFENAVTLSPL
ncbi:MAG: OmpA family protein [Verrucomicrobiales bacterium]